MPLVGGETVDMNQNAPDGLRCVVQYLMSYDLKVER
jgi:hypothetical protein